MPEEIDTSQFSPSPSEDTRERILAAAAQVFAEQGYARATTRALASAAGVTEVTLFRHFGSKENLFKAVIENFGGPAITGVLEAQLSGDYREDLLTIGNLLMKLLLQRADALRLMLCEASHFPEVRQTMAQNPLHLREMLARYFQRQIERGQARSMHAEAMAQAFLGMLFSYAVLHEMLGQDVPGVSTEELVAQFVELFIHGTGNRTG